MPSDAEIAAMLDAARATSEANSDPGIEPRKPPPPSPLPWWLGLVPGVLLVLVLTSLAALAVWFFHGLAVGTGFLPGGLDAPRLGP